MRMNAEGDQGLNVGQLGPIVAEFDLAPEDFDDLKESAIGFGGYVTNGALMVQFTLAQLDFGGQPSRTLESGATVDSDFSYDITTGEVTVGYTVYRAGPVAVR